GLGENLLTLPRITIGSQKVALGLIRVHHFGDVLTVILPITYALWLVFVLEHVDGIGEVLRLFEAGLSAGLIRMLKCCARSDREWSSANLLRAALRVQTRTALT